jgi:hypothetical protein
MTNLTLPSTTLSITCGTAADENCSRYKYSCSCQRKSQRAARELLQLGSRDHVLLLSPFLQQELERVFSYERVRASSKLPDAEIVEYLGYLRAKDVSETAPLLVSCLPT